MKNGRVVPLMTMAAVALFYAMSNPALAEDKPNPVEVHIDGAPRIVAPAWESGREYKFGELVSYDGYAFRAKSGSAHRRPNVNSEVGWEVMNACDDTSKKAIECEEENQAAVKDSKTESVNQYDRAKQAESIVRGGGL